MRFNDQKGYGFITGEDGEDVFVHHSAIDMKGHRSLEQGATFEYEVEIGRE